MLMTAKLYLKLVFQLVRAFKNMLSIYVPPSSSLLFLFA